MRRRSTVRGRVLGYYKSCRKNSEKVKKTTNAVVLYTCVLDDILPLVTFWISAFVDRWLSVSWNGRDVSLFYPGK